LANLRGPSDKFKNISDWVFWDQNIFLTPQSTFNLRKVMFSPHSTLLYIGLDWTFWRFKIDFKINPIRRQTSAEKYSIENGWFSLFFFQLVLLTYSQIIPTNVFNLYTWFDIQFFFWNLINVLESTPKNGQVLKASDVTQFFRNPRSIGHPSVYKLRWSRFFRQSFWLLLLIVKENTIGIEFMSCIEIL
jgi:hypothetical protein